MSSIWNCFIKKQNAFLVCFNSYKNDHQIISIRKKNNMYFLKFLYIITTGQYSTINQEVSKIYETRTILDTVSIVSLLSFIGTLVFFHEDVVRLSSNQFISVLLSFYLLLCLRLYLNYRNIAKEQKETHHKNMIIPRNR